MSAEWNAFTVEQKNKYKDLEKADKQRYIKENDIFLKEMPK
jgi:hypothetical protein